MSRRECPDAPPLDPTGLLLTFRPAPYTPIHFSLPVHSVNKKFPFYTFESHCALLLFIKLPSAKLGLYAMMLSICLSVCLFVSPLPRSSRHKGCPICFLLCEKFSPCEIYGCGGGLIVASVNAPQLLATVRHDSDNVI